MKTIWNDWLKQAVFIYSVLYTIATFFGCIIFSVGERKNSLPTLNFLQKNRNTHQISCII